MNDPVITRISKPEFFMHLTEVAPAFAVFVLSLLQQPEFKDKHIELNEEACSRLLGLYDTLTSLLEEQEEAGRRIARILGSKFNLVVRPAHFTLGPDGFISVDATVKDLTLNRCSKECNEQYDDFWVALSDCDAISIGPATADTVVVSMGVANVFSIS